MQPFQPAIVSDRLDRAALDYRATGRVRIEPVLDPVEADALATGFYVGGREMAEAWCESHPGIVVVMLERDSERPILIGGDPRCEVTILDE